MLLRSDSLHSKCRVGIIELQRQGYYLNEDIWGINRHIYALTYLEYKDSLKITPDTSMDNLSYAVALFRTCSAYEVAHYLSPHKP